MKQTPAQDDYETPGLMSLLAKNRLQPRISTPLLSLCLYLWANDEALRAPIMDRLEQRSGMEAEQPISRWAGSAHLFGRFKRAAADGRPIVYLALDIMIRRYLPIMFERGNRPGWAGRTLDLEPITDMASAREAFFSFRTFEADSRTVTIAEWLNEVRKTPYLDTSEELIDRGVILPAARFALLIGGVEPIRLLDSLLALDTTRDNPSES